MQALFVAKKRRLVGTLGERVRTLLTEQERTVTWLAGSIGVTRASASRIVNGQVIDPAVSLVQKIAAAFGVSVGELLDGTSG